MSRPDPNEAPDAVADLLRQRERLEGWLERLDDHAGDVASHVAARVRADYQARLRVVLDDLASHVDTLRADLERLREASADADRRHQDAADRLQELRLRHLIGELEGERWEEESAVLEGEAGDADRDRASTAAELERLLSILQEIEAPAPPAPAPAPEPEPEPLAEVEPWAETEAEAEQESGPEPAVEAEGEPEGEAEPEPLPTFGGEPEPTDPPATAASVDEGFLEELDRALAVPSGLEEVESEADTRPVPGAKCPECGYTNDPTAWYCGVCGVDLS